jgi:hypothetical protein
MVEYKILENKLREETNKNINKWLVKLLEEKKYFFNKKYKFNEEEKINKYIKKYFEKYLNAELKQLNAVAKAEDFKSGDKISLTIEWVKGSMQSNQATAFLSSGYIITQSNKTNGFGYDKESTATAEVLNEYLPLLKLMYDKKENYLKENKDIIPTEEQNDINKFLFGYGSGYKTLPSFEGGVGISCHKDIIKNLGLEWEHLNSTKTTDTYLITKKENNEVV